MSPNCRSTGALMSRPTISLTGRYQPDALLLSYRTEIGSSGAPWQRRSRFLLWLIICDLWFDSESHRAENKPHLHRANSNDTAWLVTAPWEQLTLVTDHR